MTVWDVAKALISYCKTPNDVEDVLVILRDRMALDQLSRIISGFSTKGPHVRTPLKESSAPGRPHLGLESVAELEATFRARGMTNREAEAWLRAKFGVSAKLRKGSLTDYLQRILADRGPDFAKAILNAAKQELSPNKKRELGKKQVVEQHGGLDQPGERIAELHNIFRGNGMTNADVETWLRGRFGIMSSVGKHSLEKYLKAIIARSTSSQAKQIIESAYSELGAGTASRAELESYWEQSDDLLRTRK